MSTPSQATEAYHAGPAASARPEPARVVLVGGTGGGREEDLYRLLRRRLRIFTSFFALTWVYATVGVVVTAFQPGPWQGFEGHPTFAEWWGPGGGWLPVWALLTSVGSAAVLWVRPPRSVHGLRIVELAFVGSYVLNIWVANVHPRNYHDLELAAVEPPTTAGPLLSSFLANDALAWFQFLALYSVLVPNTGRRNAAVVGVSAVGQVLTFAAFALWVRPLPGWLVYQVLSNDVLTLGLAAGLSVFAAYRIEHLRRQAAEARRLGQYMLREKLGSGGMGEVYRAEHVLLRRPCAIKLIRPEKAGDPNALRRFEREVQLTATLTHPNTVQVYDYGHAAGGTFYYVMEYLPGLTLEQLVERHGPLPPSRAVHFLRQLCGALREAHAAGLIHRDLKPGNVMVCERGGRPDVAKLLDFGLVAPVGIGPDDERLTREGTVTGTPAYMSPEQAAGQDAVDARSDVYSLGAVAYFLLTGRPPFAGKRGLQMLAAHLYETPARLTSHRPDVPPDLEGLVIRCLAKDPADRFPDMRRLDDALAACPAGRPWTEDDATRWWAENSPSGITRVGTIGGGEAGATASVAP